MVRARRTTKGTRKRNESVFSEKRRSNRSSRNSCLAAMTMFKFSILAARSRDGDNWRPPKQEFRSLEKLRAQVAGRIFRLVFDRNSTPATQSLTSRSMRLCMDAGAKKTWSTISWLICLDRSFRSTFPASQSTSPNQSSSFRSATLSSYPWPNPFNTKATVQMTRFLH